LRRHANGPIRRGWWWRFSTPALLVIVAMSGCRGCQGAPSGGGDDRPALGKVAVKGAAGATVRGTFIVLDDASIVSKARETLRQSGIFAETDGAATRRTIANVGIEVGVLADGGSEASEIGVKVRLRIDIHPATAAMVRYGEDTAAVGQAPLDKDKRADLAGAFQRLAERTTDDLLSAYAKREKLWHAGESEIAQALASSDNDLRLEAIRITGVRKLGGQLPTVLRLLTDEDEATRDAALGAVVAMGDRTAIRALAESHQMRDSHEMSKVLDAVATLGGREAKEYLSFVGETHDDPDIRSMAKAALERLKKRDVADQPTK